MENMFLNIELNCQMTVEKDISYVIEKKKQKKKHTQAKHIFISGPFMVAVVW